MTGWYSETSGQCSGMRVPPFVASLLASFVENRNDEFHDEGNAGSRDMRPGTGAEGHAAVEIYERCAAAVVQP